MNSQMCFERVRKRIHNWPARLALHITSLRVYLPNIQSCLPVVHSRITCKKSWTILIVQPKVFKASKKVQHNIKLIRKRSSKRKKIWKHRLRDFSEWLNDRWLLRFQISPSWCGQGLGCSFSTNYCFIGVFTLGMFQPSIPSFCQN